MSDKITDCEGSAMGNVVMPEDDNIYVCRCEEVTVGDIKRAIASGATTIKAIKMRTHATMGVCQGMTCRKNIEKMLREQKIDLDLCHSHTQRFPVRMMNLGDMATLVETAQKEKEKEGSHDH